MAHGASADRIQADIRPPNFRAAVKLMRIDIKKKKDRISGINGEIADTWAKVEGHKVDKIGAQIFMKLDALEPDERVAAMRAINGLADVADWPERAEDLVDRAEGTVVKLRFGDEKDEEDDGDGQDGDDGDETRESHAGASDGAAAALGGPRRPGRGGAAAPEDEAPEIDEEESEHR